MINVRLAATVGNSDKPRSSVAATIGSGDMPLWSATAATIGDSGKPQRCEQR